MKQINEKAKADGLSLRKVMYYMYNIWDINECRRVLDDYGLGLGGYEWVWSKWEQSRYDAMKLFGQMPDLICPICDRAEESYDDNLRRRK
ncbi:MAG: hypothetical protein EOM65_11820 [Synergistales bacterium]|nr:hypothetical protein [Synergistales bacterium]